MGVAQDAKVSVCVGTRVEGNNACAVIDGGACALVLGSVPRESLRKADRWEAPSINLRIESISDLKRLKKLGRGPFR